MPAQIDENFLEQRLIELEKAHHWKPRVISKLETFVRTADDYDLFRVNPIQYGSARGMSEEEAVELFVHAARVGLFEMDWQLLCAFCPQVVGSFRDLEKVHAHFQCQFCNAMNEVALDDYIQVTFTLSPQVRDNVYLHPEELPVEDYYLRYHFARGFIPPPGMTREEVVAMLSKRFVDIEPHQKRTFEFELPAGRFEVIDRGRQCLFSGPPALRYPEQSRHGPVRRDCKDDRRCDHGRLREAARRRCGGSRNGGGAYGFQSKHFAGAEPENWPASRPVICRDPQ